MVLTSRVHGDRVGVSVLHRSPFTLAGGQGNYSSPKEGSSGLSTPATDTSQQPEAWFMFGKLGVNAGSKKKKKKKVKLGDYYLPGKGSMLTEGHV